MTSRLLFRSAPCRQIRGRATRVRNSDDEIEFLPRGVLGNLDDSETIEAAKVMWRRRCAHAQRWGRMIPEISNLGYGGNLPVGHRNRFIGHWTSDSAHLPTSATRYAKYVIAKSWCLLTSL